MAAHRMVKELHLDSQPTRRRFSTDSFGIENVLVFRESKSVVAVMTDEPAPKMKTTLDVEGGTLYMQLVGTSGQNTDDLLASELLAGYPAGTRMFRFRAMRSIDGRRKKLSMKPPTSHRIRLLGERKRVWIKEFNWKHRYLIVG